MPQKIQNSFNQFLPLNYFDFKQSLYDLTSSEAVVGELLRICCEEDNVKAIEMAFERILGKPEKVVIIKRTMVRLEFPDAKTKALKATFDDRVVDEVRGNIETSKVVIDASNAPGLLLRQMVDDIADKPSGYSFEVLDQKNRHTVAEVMAANLYGIAMKGSNIAAIKLVFDYLDGAVADVIRLEGQDTILIESWADTAPFEAKQDANGMWYVEKESVT